MTQVDFAQSKDRATDDDQAELIAALSVEDADRLWSVVIQLKPYLDD
jgi:hypothetical protein